MKTETMTKFSDLVSIASREKLHLLSLEVSLCPELQVADRAKLGDELRRRHHELTEAGL